MAEEKTAQTVVNLGGVKLKVVAIAVAIAFLIGAAGGAYVAHRLKTCPEAPACPVSAALEVQPQAVSGAVNAKTELSIKPITTKGAVAEIVNEDGKVTVQSDEQKIELPAPKGQTTMTLGKDSTVQMKTSYDFKVDVTEMVAAQVKDKLYIQNAELRRINDEERRKQAAKNKIENLRWGGGGFAAGFAAGYAAGKYK